MHKLGQAVAISAAALIAAPTMASAFYCPPPPVVVAHAAGTSAAAGVAATGGFIGFVAVLVGYDLIRRTTCSGDFLHLGGPGFTEPMPNGNVMIPQCKIKKVAHKKVLRVRG